MYLSNDPAARLKTQRSQALSESYSRDLVDFFRGLFPIVTADSESPLPGASISNEALTEWGQLLAADFGATAIGLCILDADFRYLAINQTLAERNGLPAAEHAGRAVGDVLGDFAKIIEPLFYRVLQTGEPLLNIEISFAPQTRSEPGRWVEHFIPIKDEAGKVVQIGIVLVEITERKRLEASYHSVSQKLRDEKKRLQAMSEISVVLAAKWEPAKVFPKISAHLRRVLRQEFAALALRDDVSGQLVRQAIDFPMGKSVSTGGAISTARGPGGKPLEQRSSLIFTGEELRAFDPGIAESLIAEGLKSLCYVPIVHRTAPLGVLVLGSTRVDAFSTEDFTLLNQVAAQLAIAVEHARIAQEIKQLKSQRHLERGHLEEEPAPRLHFEEIIGESPAIREVLERVAVVATSDASVLVLGETGTGKGLIVHAIHRTSQRKNRSFITLNCAPIPTGLLESELFGHEKGAFTGAVSQKIGRLELADKGTLFLDEIGEIPLELQPKLLRVLQDHEFERLGGTRTIKVDLRLIAATNRDLARSVVEKEFRSDLFYRLNVFPIRVPALRERRQDIPLLVRYFVRKFAVMMNRNIEIIPSETMKAFTEWHWPGNIRELENFVQRSVILSVGRSLQAPLAEFKAETAKTPDASLEERERAHIVRVLRETGGIMSGPKGAARRLGLKRTTLQSKMQKLGINRSHSTEEKPD